MTQTEWENEMCIKILDLIEERIIHRLSLS